MAFKTHVFNIGSVLVGKAVGDIVKDKLAFRVGPLTIDGRLVVGAGSIIVGEYVPQVKMNATLKGALDIIGALNLGEWLYDQIMNIVGGAPAPAPTPAPQQAPQQAQAGLPIVVASKPAEAVGRIV